MAAGWQSSADEWTFDVQADAFLYRMVRRLVYVQVAVGQGRLRVEQVARALAEGSKLPAGLAPASGLTLVEVRYDNPVR
jgi:tRNA pseudouridine38-40 synthase